MHNIPDDCAAMPWAPWSEPDYIVPPVTLICWACDETEHACSCRDGFDPREVHDKEARQ